MSPDASIGGKVLVSLMCHPERTPRVDVPAGEGYETFVNRIPNYADAYRAAIGRAMQEGADLVTADSDGYHPVGEIVRLATGHDYDAGRVLVLPFRRNIGIQSKSFSLFFSLLRRRRIRDATGGLCGMSCDFMRSLPPLRSHDMTIHIEILKHALGSGTRIVQYPYLSGANERGESKRTSYYQLKLLRAAL